MSDSPWVTRTILQLGNEKRSAVQTGPFGSQLHAADYVKEGVPFILIRNIGDSGLRANDLPRISFSDAKRLARYSLASGDIVFSRVGRTGSCLLATDAEAGWIISGQTLRLRLDNPEIDSQFFVHALRSHAVQNFVSANSVGTTRESLNTEILLSIPILHPRCKEEQRRIAEILSILDNTIESTEALVAKYEHIKIGLMHDLFSRGVSANGRLRPPQAQAPNLYTEATLGCLPKEWDCKRLGDVCSLLKDGTHLPPVRVTSGPLLLSVQNIIEGHLRLTSSDTRISQDFFRRMHKNWSIRPGDVLLAIVGATIGKVCRVPDDFPQFTLQRSVAILRGKQEQLTNQYLFWFLLSPTFKRMLWQRVNQTAQPGVYLDQISKIMLPLPSEEEQDEISKRLEAVATMIESVKAELAKLSQLKQGMMHDLLTGRVPAKVAQQ